MIEVEQKQRRKQNSQVQYAVLSCVIAFLLITVIIKDAAVVDAAV